MAYGAKSLRVSKEIQQSGLDEELHGEQAYIT